jgi:hypothetical protein
VKKGYEGQEQFLMDQVNGDDIKYVIGTEGDIK